MVSLILLARTLTFKPQSLYIYAPEVAGPGGPQSSIVYTFLCIWKMLLFKLTVHSMY